MPEGDVVWHTARQLHAALAGHELARSELRWPTLATTDLTGRRTLEVVPRGKHLLHRLEGGLTLHSHLRMEGSWRVHPAGRPPRLPRTTRAVLATATRLAVGDTLGMLDLVPTEAEEHLVGHLGPDLLGPDWSLPVALANLRRDPDRPIAAALLDQRNLAGIGTIYASEPLFLRRVDPWRPVGAVPGATLEAVVETARMALAAACRTPGPWEGRTTPRHLRETRWVHGRVRSACLVCGTPIALDPVGDAPHDRVFFHCPSCQASTPGATPRTSSRTQ